jgi:hypothetical protein
MPKQDKPSQFLVRDAGDPLANAMQESLAQVTKSLRQQPPPKQLVSSITKQMPDQGVTFRPGQIVDIPHGLGRNAAGFNIAKVVTDTPRASSAPFAAPNLQVVEVPGALGQKIMRLRLIPPKDDNGNDIPIDPVKLNLEIF